MPVLTTNTVPPGAGSRTGAGRAWLTMVLIVAVGCQDKGEARVEPQPSQPAPGVLAGLLGDNGLFTMRGGAPILGATVDDLRTRFGARLSTESERSYTIAFPGNSFGSDLHLSLQVRKQVVVEYHFHLDYGDAAGRREVIRRALARALGGRGRPVEHGALSCSAYPVPGDRSPPSNATCESQVFACERAEVAVCNSDALKAVAVLVKLAAPPVGRTTKPARALAGRAWHLDQRVTLSEPAREPSTTPLRSGLVLMIGGIHWEKRGNHALLYNPEEGSVEMVPARQRRTRLHSATELPDGTVLVAGGTPADVTRFHISSAEAHRLDVTRKRWSSVPPMAQARYGHSAFALPDGRVLVFGGTETGGEFLRSSEIYDPRSNRWSPGPELHQGRWQHAAVQLQSGEILVAGGGEPGAEMTSEVYDVETGHWELSGALTRPWYGHQMALLADGRAWLVGEVFEAGDARPHIGSELFEPDLRTWSASAVDARTWMSFSLASVNGGVLLMGGHRPVTAQTDAPQLEKRTDTLFFVTQTETFGLGPSLPASHAGDWPQVVTLANGDLVLFARDSRTPLLLR